MLNFSRDINSLSNFKRKTPEFVVQLKETRSPLVLTVNGVAELVVQSAESYQILVDRLEYLETVAGVCQGLTERADGKGIPAIPALEGLRLKLRQKN
jgi:PHD/YefM family antitoxin component YafN of YafNO toxin-antitoxin module